MKKTPIALGILERELTRQIIKLAVMTDGQGGMAAPKPPQPVKPTTTDPVAKPIKPIAPMGQNGGQKVPPTYNPNSNTGPSTLQAFGAGLRQGVGNMTGGIYNFGRGMANFGAGALGSAAVGMGQLGARGMDAAFGGNSAQFFDEIAPTMHQAAGAGASDMANSFGQYIGVRGAPTAVADMRTQQRANLSPDLQMAHDLANGASDFAVGTGAYMLPGAGAARLAAGAGRAAAALPNAVQPAARAAQTVANAYGQATGLTGKWQMPVIMGTQIAREGIVRPIDQARGTNYADNAALFPGQLLTPPADAVAQTQIPETAAPQMDAADPAGGSEFSPELQQFLTDNNIQSADDLNNLSEEQRAQFSTLWDQHQQQQPQQADAQLPDSVTAWGGAGEGAGGAPAPGTPQGQQAGQQKIPDSVAAWGGSLPDHATPEQREQANQAQQQLSEASPEKQQQLKTGLNNPKSPEAQQLSQQAQQDYIAEAAKDPNNPMPTNDPVAAGNWLSQTMDAFGQMPWQAQLAIGAGLSVGVVSMLSSLMGGGGLGSLLLGALGIGGAGLMGAANGMFGADAQKTVTDAGAGLLTALGMDVPNEADIRARLETAAKQGPEQAKAELEKIRGEVGPYASFSPDAQKFMTDSADKNYMYNQVQQHARKNYAHYADQALHGENRSLWGELGSQLGLTGEAANQEGTWSRYFMGDPEKNIAQRMAEQGWVKQQSVNIMRKAARCWAGYEPVPGTKAYTEGSCRPKGSKKTKKEVIQGKKHSPKK